MVYIPTRKPFAAGTFYEDNKEALIAQIETCFKKGPGKIPNNNIKVDAQINAIVPHAGYSYSGACAAHVYFDMAKTNPDTVIIIGPSHNREGKISVWLGESWETPLGLVKTDNELAKLIFDLSDNLFNLEPMPHLKEHSVEVQVPFLQYIFGGNVTILPILVAQDPSYFFCKQAGEELAKAIEISGKKVAVLVSSDFTHYGVSYGFMPFFGGDIRRKIEELDKGVINSIINLDLEKYTEKVKGTTICGATPIGILLSYLKARKSRKGKLLDYYLSGDRVKSYANSVSYAGILF